MYKRQLLAIRAHFRPDRRSPLAEQLQLAADDAARRLLLPAVERDVRRALSETAERHAITVFGRNLRALLTQPPLAGHVVVGIDPGFRTGCKAAVLDPTGKVLDTATLYPHPPQKKWDEAAATLTGLIVRHGVTLIAIGNGTASRETEQLVAGLTRERPGLHYVIVNEAGASVYSAGTLARAELPDMDVTMRGAVSIGRRLLDPLAELVKIDAKSIGVGLYQHDVDQKELAAALDGVVESVVNQVGVEVNTASPALLAHVAGIGPKLAGQIVAHRDARGPFPGRAALREVSGLGPKAFEQAAGFLRIRDGANPLDAGAIHPESYGAAERVLARVADDGRRTTDHGRPAAGGLWSVVSGRPSSPEEMRALLDRLCEEVGMEQLAAELGTGVPTLADILDQLARPGRDPRADLPPPLLRSDVLSLDDLSPGLTLSGTVRNAVSYTHLDVYKRQGNSGAGLTVNPQRTGDDRQARGAIGGVVGLDEGKGALGRQNDFIPSGRVAGGAIGVGLAGGRVVGVVDGFNEGAQAIGRHGHQTIGHQDVGRGPAAVGHGAARHGATHHVWRRADWSQQQGRCAQGTGGFGRRPGEAAT